MRYATVKATPPEGITWHPVGQRILDDPSLTREALHRAELMADDTAILLAEVRGNLARLESLLDDSPEVHSWSVAGEEWGFMYMHFEPNDLARDLFESRRGSRVMLDMPIEVVADGAVEVTYVGTDEALTEAFAARPDGVSLELVETGEYRRDAPRLSAQLTARQQDVLETAVEMGYYEDPRRATHREVADALDLAPTTVGEHLRKVESTVFGHLIEHSR